MIRLNLGAGAGGGDAAGGAAAATTACTPSPAGAFADGSACEGFGASAAAAARTGHAAKTKRSSADAASRPKLGGTRGRLVALVLQGRGLLLAILWLWLAATGSAGLLEPRVAGTRVGHLEQTGGCGLQARRQPAGEVVEAAAEAKAARERGSAPRKLIAVKRGEMIENSVQTRTAPIDENAAAAW
ncbi:hypothetical protein D9Q98_003471 [Chlorella vulgaris]|uniref:Uncharacterized protein n=1 Tax=Chlorella vulgaris TaxID=3077 RepID=A0A9D4TSV3_CHLVU|nr:hypothetical protein D9Q98_003471 [Chlorella vulgaris]